MGLPVSMLAHADVLRGIDDAITNRNRGRYISITNTESMYHGLRIESQQCARALEWFGGLHCARDYTVAQQTTTTARSVVEARSRRFRRSIRPLENFL